MAARWRSALVRRGTEATELMSSRSTLLLAAHPDDETFGCGALLRRLRSRGVPVTVAFATDGSRSTELPHLDPAELARIRADEAVRACGLLGVAAADIELWRLEDGTLARRGAQLEGLVTDLLDRVRPAQLLVPSLLDDHPDHQALARAARAAVRRHPEVDLLEYLVWAWANGPWQLRRGLAASLLATVRHAPALLRPTAPLVTRIGAELEAKRAAVAAHRSQVGSLTGEGSWQHLSAEFIGLFLGDHEVFLRVCDEHPVRRAGPTGGPGPR